MTRYSILGEFIEIARSGHRKYKWHKLHPDSETIPVNQFDFNHVSVGRGTYGELNIVDFGGDCRLILNNYISIAQNVTFILNAEHHTNHISTYPFKVKLLKIQESESFGKGDIVVDDDVWIGYGATIMSGVHIGQGAIVAAGSVITRDIPPYAIVGGVPATIIKYRFAPNEIKELLKLDFSSLTLEKVKKNEERLYEEYSDKSQIEWFQNGE